MNFISLLLTILLVALICGVVYWAIDALGLPQPFARVAQVVVIVIFLIVLIYMLIALLGGGVHLPVLK